MTIEDIARIAHEANRAYCKTTGDNSQVYWEKAEEWQRRSAQVGVKFRIDTPTCDAASLHKSWLDHKKAEGWTFGEKKDPNAKTHPCMVDYDKLPSIQRAKDSLFLGVVDALKPFLTYDPEQNEKPKSEVVGGL